MDKEKFFKELKDKIDWLATHNKNYTKQQYYIILDIQELLEYKDYLEEEE
jgi:hypothetical protein